MDTHNLILDGREHLTVSGVEDVESFNEQTVVVVTTRGVLVISGAELHIERLSLDTGELELAGLVSELRYEEESGKSGGLFSRLFR